MWAISPQWSTCRQSEDSKVHLGVDPLGGASVAYYDAIAERYHLNLEVVNTTSIPPSGS